LLQTTDRIFDLAASDEWLTSFVRKYIFPYVADVVLSFDAVKRIVFPLVSQIGINYRESSLSRKENGFAVKAGDRMPWFEIEGVSIYKSLCTPSFHLLAFGESQDKIPGSEFLEIHSLPLTTEVKEYFGTDEPFVVLLRPDNYIGLIVPSDKIEIVSDYLNHLVAGTISHN
jgi:hypothetical protein